MVLVVTFAKVPSTSIRKARESSDIVSVVLSEERGVLNKCKCQRVQYSTISNRQKV